MTGPKRGGWAGRRGIALPLVVFALVLTGAIVVTLFVAGHLEVRAAGHVRRAHVARLAADGVWPGLLEAADSLGLLGMAPGDSVVLPSRRVSARLDASAVVHRLSPAVFLVESRAVASSSDAVESLVEVVAVLDSSASIPVLRPIPVPFWSALPRFP